MAVEPGGEGSSEVPRRDAGDGASRSDRSARWRWIAVGSILAAGALIALGAIWVGDAAGQREEVEGLDSTARRATAELADAETRTQEADGEAAALAGDLVEIEEELAGVRSEHAAALDSWLTLDDSVRSLAGQALDLEADLLALADRLDAATLTLQGMADGFAAAVENGNLRRLDLMESIFRAAQSDLESLQAALDFSTGEVEHLQASVDALAAADLQGGGGGEG